MTTEKTGSLMLPTILLLVALALYILLDLAAAVSLNPIISGGFALAALALGLLILNSLPTRPKLLLLTLLVTAVVAVRFVDWDGRKPFLRDYYQIQPGMTAEEVDALMAEYNKQTSPFAATDPQGTVQTGAVTYQPTPHTNTALITFAGGRVIGRTFYPD